MIKKIAILIVILYPSIVLFAQDKWSLEQCIAYALENNTDIKSSELLINSNKIVADRSKLSYIPELNFNTDYQLNISRSLDQSYSFIENISTNSLNSGLHLGTTIFEGFKKYNTYRRSISDLDISQVDREVLKNDIALSVVLSYMNVLLNKEVISSIRQQIEISDSNIEKTKRLVEEGVVTNERMQNLLIQRDNEMYSLADAEGSLKNSIVGLCSLLNIKNFDSFDIDDSFYTIVDTVPVPLYDIILSSMQLPQIESFKLKLKSAEYALKIVKGDLYPRLSFGASFAGSYSDARKKPLGSYPLFDQLSNHRYQVVSLTLNVPILSVFQTKKNILLAQNNITLAQYDLFTAKKTLNERVYQVYTEVEVANKKYQAAIASVEHAKELLLYADNKIANGTLTISDYVVTKGNLLISEAQASKAKYEYFFKLKLLKFYYTHTILD